MDSLTNVWGLLLNVYKHIHFVSVNADIVTGESNVPDSIPDHLLIIHLGSCCDFTKDHDHVGLGC